MQALPERDAEAVSAGAAARGAAREKLNTLSARLSSIDADALSDAALLSHASSVDRVEGGKVRLSAEANVTLGEER